MTSDLLNSFRISVQKPNDYIYCKVCGLTSLEDAQYVAEKGSDFLGMVFHPQSKRFCTLDAAKDIKNALPSKPRVLVFGYDESNLILDIYMQLRDLLTFIQIPHDHSEFDKLSKVISIGRIFPSIAVKPNTVIDDSLIQKFHNHSIILFDNAKIVNNQQTCGGTGKTFQWSKLNHVSRPYLLAGGLNPSNVCDALEQVAPFGVDLSSGLEETPGKKSKTKVEEFFNKLRRSEQHC